MVCASSAMGEFQAGCSKSSSSKAAASEGPRRTLGVRCEDLNDARTKLADFFSFLL